MKVIIDKYGYGEKNVEVLIFLMKEELSWYIENEECGIV